ncbi:MAG: hypothetical protein JW861_09085 [Bacteroidales bacterium]|nr:hypothetical protein [Bacteroidales bacterium]
MWKKVKPRILLSVWILMMGLIIASVPENTTKPYRLTAGQMLDEVKTRTQFLHPDVVADLIIRKDPSLRLIDVRPADEFEKYSLPGAIHIPLDDILNPAWEGIWQQDVYMNVLYSNGTTTANEAWMILRQLGTRNHFVLQGGLNYWVETIMNPDQPPSTSPDEEFARFDFRKAASHALGVGGTIMTEARDTTPVSKPIIIPVNKRKPFREAVPDIS